MTTAAPAPARLKNPFKAVKSTSPKVFRTWEVTLPGIPVPVVRFSKRGDAVSAKNALNAWHTAGGDQSLPLPVEDFIGRYSEYRQAMEAKQTVSRPWVLNSGHELIKSMREVVQGRQV